MKTVLHMFLAVKWKILRWRVYLFGKALLGLTVYLCDETVEYFNVKKEQFKST